MPISPNQGSSAGGTAVTITGTGLSNASAVHFGVNLATITANTPTQVNVISPAGHGAANVNVTTPGGTSNSLPFFYIEPPTKASISPSSGPTAGGNSVTITGTNLNTATAITFGANAGTITSAGAGTLVATAPAGTAGTVPITLTTAGGSTNGLSYTYLDAPTLASVVPAAGPTAGGTQVTITGTALTTTSSVTVGGAAASFNVLSDTELTAVTPAGVAGAADVVVTTAGGSATLAGGFTYVAGPVV